jgi:hypothetical protein
MATGKFPKERGDKYWLDKMMWLFFLIRKRD